MFDFKWNNSSFTRTTHVFSNSGRAVPCHQQPVCQSARHGQPPDLPVTGHRGLSAQRRLRLPGRFPGRVTCDGWDKIRLLPRFVFLKLFFYMLSVSQLLVMLTGPFLCHQVRKWFIVMIHYQNNNHHHHDDQKTTTKATAAAGAATTTRIKIKPSPSLQSRSTNKT